MPFADFRPEPADLDRFLSLCGSRLWTKRHGEIGQRTRQSSLSGRAAQQRHAVELVLARLADPKAMANASQPERRVLAYAREASKLAATLPAPRRARLREQIAAGLTGEQTLVPLFHQLRTAALHRSRGFTVEYAGLLDEAPFDLLITREGVTAEVVCEVVSAEEGRHVHRGDWCALVDRVNPDLQTWLAAHPDRAAEVALWQRQNEALNALFPPADAEPVPDRLKPRRLALRSRGVTLGWPQLAAAAVVLPWMPPPIVARATDASAPILNWLSITACRPRSVMIIIMTMASCTPIWRPTLPEPMP
jgi:hypothetical protein